MCNRGFEKDSVDWSINPQDITWPTSTQDFKKFVKSFMAVKTTDDEHAGYGQIAVKGNELKLIHYIAQTFYNFAYQGKSVSVESWPEISDYTLTLKDLANPWIFSVKDEPFISIKMKAHFYGEADET